MINRSFPVPKVRFSRWTTRRRTLLKPVGGSTEAVEQPSPRGRRSSQWEGPIRGIVVIHKGYTCKSAHKTTTVTKEQIFHRQ